MKSGTHDSISETFWKPRNLTAKPSTKTSTISPYAAHTERRLSRIAFAETTIERKVIVSITKLSPRTKMNVSGSHVFVTSPASTDSAVVPATYTFAFTPEKALGT